MGVACVLSGCLVMAWVMFGSEGSESRMLLVKPRAMFLVVLSEAVWMKLKLVKLV